MPISVQLSPDVEKRLTILSESTGKPKDFYIREAIQEYLDDLEDIYLAEKRLEDLHKGLSRTYSLEEVERELGLEN